MKRMFHLLTVLLAIIVSNALPAWADTDIKGVWKTGAKNGSWGYIRFYNCGSNYCGMLISGGGRSVDISQFGTIIVRNMKRNGDSWSGGQILDTDSGKLYTSKMRLLGPNRLKVQGCVLGEFLCGGQIWIRE